MKPITVFTPTYNRAYCLHQLYDSLVRQTSPDFIWMIIDDGSTDETKTLVESWKAQNKIEIDYVFQQNQGMHGAHNTAYTRIQTEFNTCIDSDDYMPDDAIAVIVENTRNLDPKFAGIVGLDIDKSGKIMGEKMPDNLTESTLTDLYNVHGAHGDKKLVYRTEVVRKYPPYPLFKGENFVPLGTLYAMIDRDYLLKPINKPLVVVEYLADGSSRNILRQYRKNPRGFAYARLKKIESNRGLKEKFISAVHLVSSAIFTKDFSLLAQARKPLLIAAALPFGLLLNLYIRNKTAAQ
ncbi:glycosyltransferase family 2 protein [Flavobacterium sp.]|uniref:glycosyltransferase family 2 protein n=1 Tax=Flavobacterium sp. TaxID=239 RepID=UPI0039E724FF